MPLADYAHWNEDAQYMWWHEEGRHVEDEPYDDYDEAYYRAESAAEAAAEEEYEQFADEVCGLADEEFLTLACDADWRAKLEAWALDLVADESSRRFAMMTTC